VTGENCQRFLSGSVSGLSKLSARLNEDVMRCAEKSKWFFSSLVPVPGRALSSRTTLVVLCVVLVGCGQRPSSNLPADEAKPGDMAPQQSRKAEQAKEREEVALKIENGFVARLHKNERQVTVLVDDVSRYLKQPDAPKRKGVVKFVSSGVVKKVGDQSWVEASYFRSYNGFTLGYLLKGRVKDSQLINKEIDVKELADVAINYTDDRREARGLTEKDVGKLIEQLAEPANKVVWVCSIVPGGEILEFSTPMKKLLLLGAKGRAALQKRLGDRRVQNEVALILGAIGDETTVPALIDVYPTIDVRAKRNKGDATTDPECLNVVCLTFALTYLTGEPIGRSRWGTDCDPRNHKLWQEWWATSKKAFKVPNAKPNATWVPSYPILTENWATRVRDQFANASE
jgi:hypothetical protein